MLTSQNHKIYFTVIQNNSDSHHGTHTDNPTINQQQQLMPQLAYIYNMYLPNDTQDHFRQVQQYLQQIQYENLLKLQIFNISDHNTQRFMNISYQTDFLREQQLLRYKTCYNWTQYYSLIDNKCIEQQDCNGVVMNNYWCSDHCFMGLTTFTTFEKQDHLNWCEADCQGGYVQFTGLCLFQCPVGYVNQTNMCVTECLNGFQLVENVCQVKDQHYVQICNGDALIDMASRCIGYNGNQQDSRQQIIDDNHYEDINQNNKQYNVQQICEMWNYKGVCVGQCPETSKYQIQDRICIDDDQFSNYTSYNRYLLETCFGNKLIFQDKFNKQRMSFCTDRCIRGQYILRELGLCVENCSQYDLETYNQICVLESEPNKKSRIIQGIFDHLTHQCQYNKKIYGRLCLDDCIKYGLYQNNNYCVKNCSSEQFLDKDMMQCLDEYNQKYCIKKCLEDAPYSYNKICMKQCPEGTFTEQIYKYCYIDCKGGRILYNKTLCIDYQDISKNQWYEILENNFTNCDNYDPLQDQQNGEQDQNVYKSVIYDLDQHKCTNIQNKIFQLSWCPPFYYYNNNQQICNNVCSSSYPVIDDQDCKITCSDYTTIQDNNCIFTCKPGYLMTQKGCIKQEQCKYASLKLEIGFQQVEQLYCSNDCSQQQNMSFYSVSMRKCIHNCSDDLLANKVYYVKNWSGICYQNCPNNTVEFDDYYCDNNCGLWQYSKFDYKQINNREENELELDQDKQNIKYEKYMKCVDKCDGQYLYLYDYGGKCTQFCGENYTSLILNNNIICDEYPCQGLFYSNSAMCFSSIQDSFLIQPNLLRTQQKAIQKTFLWKSICQSGILAVILLLLAISWIFGKE